MMDLAKQLRSILGDCCPIPSTADLRGTLEVSVTFSTLESLVAYWKSLPSEELPRLHGLTVSREETPKLHLLMSARHAGVKVLLSAELPSKGTMLPLLSEVWPHAEWWEGELGCFEGVGFGGVSGPRRAGGVAWRQS